MIRKMMTAVGIAMLCLTTFGFADDTDATQEQIDELKQEIKDLEKRVMKTERKSALDRINFSGDFRFEMNSFDMDFDSYYDGMALQRMLVDTLFYFGATGMPPASPEDVQGFIAQNYGDYLYYLNNVVNFDWLKETMGQFPPEMQQALMSSLLPYTYQEGYNYSNDILYTNRLRLQMDAKVSDSVDFAGRLAMYKVWGDSTGVQVFNGQPTSINTDGTTATVPNSDILRVERAYFTWHSPKFYLSIGRRPSTGGTPLNYRENEPRGGTPLGSAINYQFDGATLGWHINDYSTVRLCYGIGYESGFGNGDVLRPADRLKDATLFGVNWDIFNNETTFLQVMVAGAWNVTDGFNGLVVMPVDPVTGQDVPPFVMRYTPSANLGDMSWAGAVFTQQLGGFDFFASLNYSDTDPNDVTTPFGGLLSDPFAVPESHDGYMYYLGGRYTFPDGKNNVGIEYNHGSEYWINFANAEDSLFAPKTAARGDVFEVYYFHEFSKHFMLKLDYMHYDYKYSGSGWHIGAPKELDSTPILGFATPSKIDKFLLGLQARF
jgi:hypothetical protein